MTQPTFTSVTDELCKCGYLQRAADDPDLPIVFDTDLNEYNFEHPSPCSDGACEGAKATLIIYHCPFCGGAAPKSKRDLLLAVIPRKEEQRLYKLLEGIETLDEAIRVLGPPDEDWPHGVTERYPEQEGKAPTVQSFHTLWYRRLSATADVQIIDSQTERPHMVLIGKYLGTAGKG